MKAVGVLAGVTGLGMAVAVFSSVYVVNEGRVGVITHMGQAVRQEGPSGVQFKAPFVSGVREFDVRERAIPLTLTGATSNQLSTTVEVSVNWRPDPTQIMDIFVNYGGPEEFAANVLRPRLSQAAKAAIGQFSSVQLTKERNVVAEAIQQKSIDTLEGYPALLSSVQIENFSLPDRYWEAVLLREEQRETTERERLRLEQQDLQAQQEVQTAAANRDAVKARADGEAYRVRVEAAAAAEAIEVRGIAQAEAIEAQARALEENPLFVEYSRNNRWDGTLPTVVMGDQPELLMQMPTAN